MDLHQAAGHLVLLNAWLVPLMRVLVVLAVIFVTYVFVYVLGVARVTPLARLALLLFILACAIAASWAVCVFSPLLVAKGALVIGLVLGGIFCLIFLCVLPELDRALTNLQRDCELATQLSYMQGEMTRAQLETLNDRLKQAVQPEEREITESVLRSISPLVMMYFRKEKNIIKWSMAAANLGKGVLDYFFKH